MRFMMFVKHNGNSGAPPKEFMDAMTMLSEEAVKSGTIRGSGGLAPIAQGTHVRLAGGQIEVTDGPYIETKELVGGYAEFELKSKEEAVESAVKFINLHKKYWPGWEGVTEVRQIFSPEDYEGCAELAQKQAS